MANRSKSIGLVQPAMRDLVDTGLPWAVWMPVADRKQEQRRGAVQGAAEEHRSPLSGWLRNVDLHAAG